MFPQRCREIRFTLSEDIETCSKKQCSEYVIANGSPLGKPACGGVRSLLVSEVVNVEDQHNGEDKYSYPRNYFHFHLFAQLSFIII